MKLQKVDTVALVDPRWNGHHPSFFREFLASMLRLGVRVLALCPDPEGFRRDAAAICLEQGLDPADWVVTEKLSDAGRGMFPGASEHDALSTIRRWWRTRSALRRAEKRSGWKTQFVFFAWLDSYLRFLPHQAVPGLILNRPWGGLYFRNHHLSERSERLPEKVIQSLKCYAKGDHALRSRGCRMVGVLDERFEQELHRICGKPVLPFPDIASDITSPALSSPAKEIVKKARGRKIIGLVGLEKRKGFLTLLKAALEVKDKESWFFVFAGALHRDTLTPQEIEWLHSVERNINVQGEIDNIHIDLRSEPITNEADFNDLITVFDVVYAAYDDFQGSSNTLTKAAIFEKPVLASRGACMEKRVNEFQLGICIDQGDVRQCIDGIRRLLEGRDWDERPLESQFREYRARHSRDQLDAVFREALKCA